MYGIRLVKSRGSNRPSVARQLAEAMAGGPFLPTRRRAEQLPGATHDLRLRAHLGAPCGAPR